MALAGGREGTASISSAEAEAARLRVTEAIHTTLDKIRALHPALGRHLDRTIKTGRVCAYEPEHPHRWAT